MSKILEGKVAIVTGGGRGIGRATALLMAEQGAKVVVNDLGGAGDGTGSSATVAEQVAAEIKALGGEAVANGDSVASPEGAGHIVQCAVAQFGKIDVLVNIAGILRDKMLWNMSDEDWDTVVKVHLYGHFYCTRAAVRSMREAIREGKQKNGRIINFTSASAFQGNAGQPNYGAAKAGIVGFTYSTALACESLGITCNAVAPSALTRMTDTIPEDRLRAGAKRLGLSVWDHPEIAVVKKALLGGDPSAVATLVVWLASDEAQHVTGQAFRITEGSLGLYPKLDPTKTAYSDGPFSLAGIARAMAGMLPKPAESVA